MKKKYLKPFIEQLFINVLFFVEAPVFLLSTKSIEITFNYKYGFAVMVLVICLYLRCLLAYLLPGISVIYDVVTNNTITCQMSYMESYIATQSFYLHRSRINQALKAKKQLQGKHYLRVILMDEKRKSSYATTFLHHMEKGENYTVTYGQYSKILFSVMSAQGQEMLLFDVE